MGEIENIIPDYTHQSQTVVARGRPAPAAAHGLGRLADNGLSASSTSTATSSPDSKPNGGASGAGAQSPAAISSRMDTFPIDSPIVGISQAAPHYSSAAAFGGRYGTTSAASLAESMTSSSAGVVVARQRHPASLGGGSVQSVARSAKLVAEPGAQSRQKSAKYQQRSGLQAQPQQKPGNAQQKVKTSNGGKRPAYGAAGGQLRASASTVSRSPHQYQSSSSQATPASSSTISSSISRSSNINNNDNLLANSHDQFVTRPRPSTSSIQAANNDSKHRIAAPHQLNTTPRLSIAPAHTDANDDLVNISRQQQSANVNHQHHNQKAQHEPMRSGTTSRTIHSSSPALYLTSPSSRNYPMSITAVSATAA